MAKWLLKSKWLHANPNDIMGRTVTCWSLLKLSVFKHNYNTMFSQVTAHAILGRRNIRLANINFYLQMYASAK